MSQHKPEKIYSKDKSFYLEKGVDKEFFDLLYKLYKPFLSSAHKKDKNQFSIFSSGKLIGFFQVGFAPANFVQFALIPEERGQGIIKEAVRLIVDYLGLKKVGWTACKENYPSLKLLYNLGGGVFRGSLKNSTKKAEGALKIGGKISGSCKENLGSILEESKNKFQEWLVEEYEPRKSEREELVKYLDKQL